MSRGCSYSAAGVSRQLAIGRDGIDTAEGIVLAAERYDGPEPVNLSAGQRVTIREIVTLIAEPTGFSGEVRRDPTKPDGQPGRALDTTRALERFGCVAGTYFAEGLGPAIDSYERTRAEWHG